MENVPNVARQGTREARYIAHIILSGIVNTTGKGPVQLKDGPRQSHIGLVARICHTG
jgi:hypothetical protein